MRITKFHLIGKYGSSSNNSIWCCRVLPYLHVCCSFRPYTGSKGDQCCCILRVKAFSFLIKSITLTQNHLNFSPQISVECAHHAIIFDHRVHRKSFYSKPAMQKTRRGVLSNTGETKPITFTEKPTELLLSSDSKPDGVEAL